MFALGSCREIFGLFEIRHPTMIHINHSSRKKYVAVAFAAALGVVLLVSGCLQVAAIATTAIDQFGKKKKQEETEEARQQQLQEDAAAKRIENERTMAKLKSLPAEELDSRLFPAAEFDSIAKIRQLLDAGADVNARNQRYETPLHRAASRGRAKIISVLIKQGADVNAKNSGGDTPLRSAINVRGEHVNAVNALIAAGADVRARNNAGHAVFLHRAAYLGHAKIARQLIAAGAVVNARDGRGNTPLHLAARGKPTIAALETLIAANANVNVKSKDGRTPLHMAVSDTKLGEEDSFYQGAYNPVKSRTTIKILITSGANVNARDNSGHTPLHLVAFDGNVPFIKALLKAGANPKIKAENGLTAGKYCYERHRNSDCRAWLEL